MRRLLFLIAALFASVTAAEARIVGAWECGEIGVELHKHMVHHLSLVFTGRLVDPPPTKWSDLRYVSTSRRTAMARKRYKPEEIVAKLRQVDVLVSQGQDMADAIRQIGVSEVTYYRWRQEFGGLKVEQVKRLKDLELENSRLRKAVSDLTLDKLILQEAARGNF
jgi:putative transposase